MKWTKKEIKYLVDNYKKYNNIEIAKILGKTVNAVSHKKYRLRLLIRPWSKKEDDLLRKLFPKGSTASKEVIKKLIKHLHRSERAIHFRLWHSKLLNDNRWTDKEIKYLEIKCRTLTDEQIAQKLNRTESAVAGKRNILGLKRVRSDLWTKDKITKIVKLLDKKGTDLSATNLKNKGYAGMMIAAGRVFKCKHWSDVLKMIGINKTHSRHIFKNKRKVIKEIKRLHDKGEDISIGSLIKNHPALGAWIDKNTKHWDLLKKSGIPPEKAYKKKPQNYWTRDIVLDRLETISEEKLPLSELRIVAPNLCAAAGNKKLFKGGYRQAINALGKRKRIPNYYEQIRRDKNTSSRYGMAFQNLVSKVFDYLKLNYIAQYPYRNEKGKTLIPDFYDKESDIWIDAKLNPNTIGVNKTINKYKKHCNGIIIVYLKRNRKSNDKQVIFRNINYYYPKLMKLGKKGIALCNKIEVLKSEKLPRKTLDIWAVIWNKKNIITEFKRVKKRRGPLHSAYMQKNYGPLFHAILHQYGTYCNFIKIMGLDYEAIKREGKVRTIEAHQKYSRESLLQQGVDWYKKGVHLAPMKIRELNSEVYHSITNEKYFGSWEKYILALRVCLKKLGHANFELLRYRSLWSRKL